MSYISSNNTKTAPHSTNAALRSESPYQQRTTQKDNPTQQLIKQAVDFLIQQLEAGKSETLTAYLAAMARFHSYSFGNVLLIARQNPQASYVAGMWSWNQLGRRVKRGEKGIAILAPMVAKVRKDQDNGTEDNNKNQRALLGFRRVFVWDHSQTEGDPLPEFAKVTGDASVSLDRLREYIASQGITLEYNESIAPAQGMAFGTTIRILPGQTQAEEFSTTVHELAHLMLKHSERHSDITKTVRETEAEAIAFVVGKSVGLTTSTASSDYINLYHGNAALLAESLELVQQTAGVILAAIHPEETAARSMNRISPQAAEPENDTIAEVA